jgi:hypothetical protein
MYLDYTDKKCEHEWVCEGKKKQCDRCGVAIYVQET